MRLKLPFALRAIGLSILLFALWPPVSAAYAAVLSVLTETVRLMFGAEPVGLDHEKYSFFLVPVISIVAAASGVRCMEKLRFIALALASRLALDVFNMASGAYKLAEGGADFGQGPVASTISIFYQPSIWALPLLLVVLFLQGDPARLWSRAAAKTVHLRCPICGASKIGLSDHIKHVHGEQALESKKVRALLSIEERKLQDHVSGPRLGR
jgi:hypothetical protein